MSKWILTDEVREKYLPIIKEHIDMIRNCNLEEMDRYNVALNLSDTELNPYTLGKLLEELGYKNEPNGGETNGWEVDYWYYYYKKKSPTLCIRGTMIIFQMFLSGYEEDEEYYD